MGGGERPPSRCPLRLRQEDILASSKAHRGSPHRPGVLSAPRELRTAGNRQLGSICQGRACQGQGRAKWMSRCSQSDSSSERGAVERRQPAGGPTEKQPKPKPWGPEAEAALSSKDCTVLEQGQRQRMPPAPLQEETYLSPAGRGQVRGFRAGDAVGDQRCRCHLASKGLKCSLNHGGWAITLSCQHLGA